MEFMLGCNYWASNAGVEMWRDFDRDAICRDIKKLAEYGVTHIRAFPNWRDFQPLKPVFGCEGVLQEYCLEDKTICNNDCYLDETMLDRFSSFLDICEENKLKLVIGLLTGWMSGGLFIPTALYGKNLITDPLAQYLEQLFIEGFVKRFKNRECIIAWDLGNECNCLAPVSERWEAVNWTAIIAGAIRAADPTRPVISGMHGLGITGKWQIGDQGRHTDMLTTHPYPYYIEHTRIDEAASYRITMHATAQAKYYAEISGKPCLTEEIGTMGPSVCGNDKSADFIRINMFSLWANGSSGLMWWCANEQNELETVPYTEFMNETELGLFDAEDKPKPVLLEMQKFSSFINKIDFELPPAQEDAVCVLTRDQDHWGIAYMTHILARGAGLNCRFADAEKALPDSKLYLMPSINGFRVINKLKYNSLKQRVRAGADLYISIDDSVLSDFEALLGLKVIDSYKYPEAGSVTVDEKRIDFSREFHLHIEPTTAQVLARDDKERPIITVNRYGKGRVFTVNFPLEKNLTCRRNAFPGNEAEIYRMLFKEHTDGCPIKIKQDGVVMTYHPSDEEGGYAVILNHSAGDVTLRPEISPEYSIEKIYYGEENSIKAFDACVLKMIKRQTP